MTQQVRARIHTTVAFRPRRHPQFKSTVLIESICIAETAVPWAAFKAAGYDISFATESGKVPRCDKKMIEGITQKLLVRRSPFRSRVT